MVDALKKNHPKLYDDFGGDKGLTKKLGTMYLDMKFSQGTRSQEAIRKVTQGIAELPENHAAIRGYFEHELPYQSIAQFAPVKPSKNDISTACEALVQLLVKADVNELTEDDLRVLRRTNLQISGILEEVGST